MKIFRRLALAAALLGGGIGLVSVTQVRAAGLNTPIFVPPTPDQFSHMTSPLGTPIEFDVQGHDEDQVVPNFTYDFHSAASAAATTRTPVALPAPLSTRELKEHVVVNPAVAGDYGVTITVNDADAGSNTRILFFHFTAPVITNVAPVITEPGPANVAGIYFGFTHSAPLAGTDTDANEELTWSINPPVAGASITQPAAPGVNPSSATFNFNALDAGQGLKTINIVLTDDDGATDTHTFTINVLGKQPTLLVANPALVAIPGRTGPLPLTVSARLYGIGGLPIPGRPVGFFLRGNFLCLGVTNASGYASCQAVISALLATLNLDYDAVYGGSPIHFGAADDGRIIGLLGLPLP